VLTCAQSPIRPCSARDIGTASRRPQNRRRWGGGGGGGGWGGVVLVARPSDRRRCSSKAHEMVRSIDRTDRARRHTGRDELIEKCAVVRSPASASGAQKLFGFGTSISPSSAGARCSNPRLVRPRRIEPYLLSHFRPRRCNSSADNPGPSASSPTPVVGAYMSDLRQPHASERLPLIPFEIAGVPGRSVEIHLQGRIWSHRRRRSIKSTRHDRSR